jgi:hypothetical protein
MKAIILALPLLLCPALSSAQNGLVPPQVVRLESLQQDSEMKVITVGNAEKHYTLYCNVKAEGCITPERGQNYLVFDTSTRWKMPGAKDFLTLAFIQDWTVKYNDSVNIGLVPQGGGGAGGLGMYILDGIEQDTIFSDGPIVYGAGMNDQDRQHAWEVFVLKMAEAVSRQHGKDAPVRTSRRCLPNQDYCTMVFDADFVGIHGMREPTKVILIVATDVRDEKLQLSRMVCTRLKGQQVCRDWSTGKLVVDDPAQ